MADIRIGFRSNRLWARAMRSSVWIGLSYSGSQIARLGANLILTRILVPEAFGLMALVTVFLVGLQMFCDVGLRPAIQQHARGDDPEFLNTAWTLQVIRGVVLWLVACALAWPAAWFYGEPMLAQVLPISGLTLLIAGFNPTRILTAQRHLSVGKQTALELTGQLIGIAVMIGAALIMRSVWALVIGGIVGAIAVLVLSWAYLPGERNRLRWEPGAARELIGFGKWIFLSTGLTFFMMQGDKAILGKFLSLDFLGFYQIGQVLASFPAMLGLAVVGRIMIPLYREQPPWESRENFAKLRRMRLLVSSGIIGMLIVMACIGVWLVGVLYDPRYQLAGGIAVLVACIQMIVMLGMTYEHVALAAGDSRRYFHLSLVRAALLVSCLLLGALGWGLLGALIGQAVAAAVTHVFIARLAAKHQAWDPLHDAVFAGVVILGVTVAVSLNLPALTELAGQSR